MRQLHSPCPSISPKSGTDVENFPLSLLGHYLYYKNNSWLLGSAGSVASSIGALVTLAPTSTTKGVIVATSSRTTRVHKVYQADNRHILLWEGRDLSHREGQRSCNWTMRKSIPIIECSAILITLMSGNSRFVENRSTSSPTGWELRSSVKLGA